ncbi:DUF934 domain-containing protein [Acetobacter ghanensis]|uniref:DUF934 domain-containing protein n=1 Tax=Acetobacter ghanensis TaxID=431306 RepID=A0A0U5BKB3_9PROT|nr:DUF934 domain-containing protein [Acetobacter ghanensis]NHO38226.1 DUF934 domain-containing protein [Acetobacter ghanensis]GBQ51133.1 hypothetical protein AA18895_2158 [Acetobacter ghanensis DSM 18895]CEF55849.1 hypothetical protein AGA_1648 [Acetobacter ghanensis]
MPLLENGQIVEDGWTLVQDDHALPDGDILVPLARLSEGLGRNGKGRLGVALKPDERVEELKEALPRIDLVSLTFPIFRDGRAFTQARSLREHLHFAGSVRVTGHFLPDQYEFLLRCGVSQLVIPEGSDPAVWQKAHERITVAYQPSVLNERPEGFAFRRFLSP